MNRLTLSVLVAGFAVTAACSSPTAEKADGAVATTQPVPTTTTTRLAAVTTTVDKRPGSPQVYAEIAAATDCATLQDSFDRAEATSKRPGGPAGATWAKIGIAYMKAADDRMDKIGCY